MSFKIGQKVRFGNQTVNGIVKSIRNDGPTNDFEESLVYFEDGDQCWVGSMDLKVFQGVTA